LRLLLSPSVPSLVLWMATSDGSSLPQLGVASLLPVKSSRLTAGGVRGGDAAQLLYGVPKNVIVRHSGRSLVSP
jgi:hypothetical protein